MGNNIISMSKPNFKIGIKNKVNAEFGVDVLNISFLDTIQNPTYYDWDSGDMEEGNLVAEVMGQVNNYNPSLIHVDIDSFGGSLPIAISIYNFLKDHPAKVECKITGFCASAATVIACAASKGKLTMPAGGYFITHEAQGNDISGRVSDIEQSANFVKSLTATMANILAERNTKGHTSDEIQALWISGDCVMNGEEAKEYGFVDDCYNGKTTAVTARVNEAKKIFKSDKIISVTASVEDDNEEDSNEITKTFMKDFKSIFTATLDKLKGKKVDTAKPEVMAEINALLAPSFAELATEIQTEVTAEISKVTTDVTASVTAAIENKYKDVIASLESKNSELETSLKAITADLTKFVGKQANVGGTGTKESSIVPYSVI